MNRPSCVAAALAVAAALLAAAGAWAETCSLQLKRLDSRGRPNVMGSDYMYRATNPQHFFMQIGAKEARPPGDPAEQFKKIVKKELAKYNSEQPFRNVAELGSDKYAFVLDAKDAKSKRYDRLYFDLNHNGDLTDDKPIDVEQQTNIPQQAEYWQAQFPRVDLAINVDGTKIEYSFFFQLYSHGSGDFRYVSASLNAGAYREGEITLDGKKHRVALVDFNSNGRFDDQLKLRDDVHSADGRVFPTTPDALLVDADQASAGFANPYDTTSSKERHQLSKLLFLDGKFYSLEVTPAGDRLTITPSSAETGFVKNPGKGFRAVMIGDQGAVKVVGDEGKPIPLPVGTWKVLAYTIDRTGFSEAKKEPAKPKPDAEKGPAGKVEKKETKSQLLQALGRALVGGAAPTATRVMGPRLTTVSASMSSDSKSFEVKKGETITLPVGPPYNPIVRPSYRSGSKEVRLELSLVGSGGEICTDMMVNGGRPDKPKFTIRNAKGAEVATGSFEYG